MSGGYFLPVIVVLLGSAIAIGTPTSGCLLALIPVIGFLLVKHVLTMVIVGGEVLLDAARILALIVLALLQPRLILIELDELLLDLGSLLIRHLEVELKGIELGRHIAGAGDGLCDFIALENNLQDFITTRARAEVVDSTEVNLALLLTHVCESLTTALAVAGVVESRRSRRRRHLWSFVWLEDIG